ncbi:MAG TPA: magnesium/cobalt transporter CorA [Anaeromyxobacteraceae bacterium]|nr:magnesium/cobalt transporter CorA [Anaeromyxobacteraceae bacterium]
MLVNCAAYQDGRKLANIQREEVSAYLQRPGCFVWVALKDPDAAELEQLEAQFELPPLAVEDARHGHQRPKLEEYGDSLFVVLHTIEPDGEALTTGEVAVFVGSNYVLSVRRGAQQGFATVRARCELQPELLKQGSGFVLYALMDAVVDWYFPVLESLEAEAEALEERIFGAGPARESVEALYALKRKLMVLQHAARPLAEAVGRLYGGRVPTLAAATQEYFRDVADHLQRIHGGIESLREMVTTAMSVNLSLISLQENETTKRLAAYASLVAVPTLIAGLYGMNFQEMPGLRWGYGFPVAVGVMIALDTWVYTRFRRARWL